MTVYPSLKTKSRSVPINLNNDQYALPTTQFERAGLYPALIAAIQADASSDYDILRSDSVYQATNAAQHQEISFTEQGVQIRPEKSIERYLDMDYSVIRVWLW